MLVLVEERAADLLLHGERRTQQPQLLSEVVELARRRRLAAEDVDEAEGAREALEDAPVICAVTWLASRSFAVTKLSSRFFISSL